MTACAMQADSNQGALAPAAVLGNTNFDDDYDIYDLFAKMAVTTAASQDNIKSVVSQRTAADSYATNPGNECRKPCQRLFLFLCFSFYVKTVFQTSQPVKCIGNCFFCGDSVYGNGRRVNGYCINRCGIQFKITLPVANR